jgi:hypothetical protein
MDIGQVSRHSGSQKWSFSQGTGLNPAQREAYKPHVAALALVTYLVYFEESAFAEQVNTVAQGQDPLKVARVYGNGARRDVIAALLTRGVEAKGDPEQLMRLTFRRAFWGSGETKGRGAYAYRPDFHQLIDQGAKAIMRRGAERCLSCGEKLAEAKGEGWTLPADPDRRPRESRRHYCPAHSTLQRASEHEWTEHTVSQVFKWGKRAEREGIFLPRG